MLIDGYVDEPSCLGVPPYISPHIRYAYGALLDMGIDPNRITYITIDQLRSVREEYLETARAADAVVVIAGVTVPGRYLGGRPISRREITELAAVIEPVPLILGGPIVLYDQGIPHVKLCGEIAAASLQEFLAGHPHPKATAPGDYWAREIARWAVLGAELTTRHPNFPYVVCELETFRGCPRRHNCTFCSEARKRVHYRREVADVVSEVAALARCGNAYFRIGCQTDLFLYGARRDSEGLLRVQPQVIAALYEGIRQAAPGLKLLHMDNASPATIMRDPAAAEEVIDIITRHNTPGDVAAFGLESADPQVLAVNLVETTPEETLEAVRLMNRAGGWRQNGIPKLLPGLNFIHGLQGERRETMEINYRYLKNLLDKGLMVRRINIRQVLPWGNYRPVHVPVGRFRAYKEKINREINRPMLQRIFPLGTELIGVHIEEVKGQMSFGRQLGSYPILVGIPGEHRVGEILNVRVIDHGYRSITALPSPFYINRASVAELAALPGVGRKRATRIFLAQPISGPAELNRLLDGQVDLSAILPWCDFS